MIRERWKRWRARKQDQTEIILHEVNLALKRQEFQHISNIESIRMENFKSQNQLQDDLQKEIEQVKIKQRKILLQKLSRQQQSYDLRIQKLNDKISEGESKVKFAQEFWRKLFSDSDDLHNIAIVLMSKAQVLLENERDEVAILVQKRAEDYKGIAAEYEKLDLINRKLNKMSGEAEKLISLNVEE